MIQLLESERNNLRNLLQATSDVIEHFKNRRSIVSFDLYPITVITDGLAKWHNVAGFHIGFIVKSNLTQVRVLQKEVIKFLRTRSEDSIHDPTWWERYKVRWHTSNDVEDWNGGFRFWIQLRLKGYR